MKNNVICIENLFKEQYIVPIYQRNFDWGEDEIHQLIDDIIDFKYDENIKNKYYLGLLVVGSEKNEVVDGQQRLTTLYLIFKYLDLLKYEYNGGGLKFECRDISNNTLILNKDEFDKFKENPEYDINSRYDLKIINAYNKFIKEYLLDEDKVIKLKNNLKNVYIIKNMLSSNINLNHYFELMNTRGEQLEKQDIIKSYLIEKIVQEKKGTNKQKEMEAINIIWQACQNMDNYVQMNFDINIRKEIFGKKWNRFDCKDYNSLIKIIKSCKNNINDINNDSTLLDILSNNNKSEYIVEKEISKKSTERFESILSFPNFLLQLNRAINYDENNSDNIELDDKNLITVLNKWCKSTESAKKFIFNLLKYRLIYDKYIIKRDYKEQQDGEWSLKYLKKAKGNNPQYDNNTFDGILQKQMIAIESCLRITFTSPKSMDWIYKLMRYISDCGECDVIEYIEDIAKEKVKTSDYKNKTGFSIERIVYTYLDYILYRDNILKDIGKYSDLFKNDIKFEHWNFSFRNSIEHFFPQHPNTDNDVCEGWMDLNGKFTNKGKNALNSIGNLALVTVSANSKFSNMIPEQKIKESIINQSLKLIIMKNLVENYGWSPEIVIKHEKDMLFILDDEICKNN